MDSYQPIYDAVRSKISGCDAASVIDSAVRQCLDPGMLFAIAQEQVTIIANEYTRPCVLFRPVLSLDGASWCALYGEDLASGVAGFGDTPAAAMAAFDVAWNKH